MRVLITASGIQDYIFAINAQSAGARLRGRSAQLGLVMDYCLSCLAEKHSAEFQVLRNAGSRLEMEFQRESAEIKSLLVELQMRLDSFSSSQLRGQVWFTVAFGDSAKSTYRELVRQKLSQGRTLLQSTTGQRPASWNEGSFVLPPHNWSLDKEQARNLPESCLGLALVRLGSRYLSFSTHPPADADVFKVAGAFAVFNNEPPSQGLAWTLDDGDLGRSNIMHKRLACYAPICGDRLCDLDEIASRSSGAPFLGVLKGDVDNLGAVFAGSGGRKETDFKRLSEGLERLFTEDLDMLMRSDYQNCYVVYSGGDDMLLLGPWDQLLRFVSAFRERLKRSVQSWEHPELTLSAGFRLTHSKSPVRYLAEDSEVALRTAKASGKDCICVFERLLRWDELHAGIEWADRLVAAVEAGALSSGFLQRMQFYSRESRRFYERQEVDGLRMIPLLQNDWHRNIDRIGETVRDDLNREVRPLLAQPTDNGARMWRIIDFAVRFADYATRERSSQNGR